MDIMKPDVMCIRGQCHRKNTLNLPSDSNRYEEHQEEHFEPDEYADSAEEEEDIYTEGVEVEEMAKGWFRTKLDIGSVYYGFLIGTGGNTRKRVENETNTKISYPMQNSKEVLVTITSKSKKCVLSACRRIYMMIDEFRNKQDPTHFLSLPVVHQNIQDAFLHFKEEVLRTCENVRGIEESIFQNPKKLHLTIGMFALNTPKEKEYATQVLKMAHEETIRPIVQYQPLTVRMRGIEYMNDDPAEVDVLYGKMEGSKDLQMLVDLVAAKFARPGLMKSQFDKVKLHVTLMNSRFRRSEEKGKRETFDARMVLENFRDYDFGTCNIDSLHLSVRYSGKNSYYQSTSFVNFTE